MDEFRLAIYFYLLFILMTHYQLTDYPYYLILRLPVLRAWPIMVESLSGRIWASYLFSFVVYLNHSLPTDFLDYLFLRPPYFTNRRCAFSHFWFDSRWRFSLVRTYEPTNWLGNIIYLIRLFFHHVLSWLQLFRVAWMGLFRKVVHNIDTREKNDRKTRPRLPTPIPIVSSL